MTVLEMSIRRRRDWWYLDVSGDVHLTGADGAQAALLQHLTLGVGVGDARWEPAATGLWARAPRGGLADAVPVLLTGAGPHWAQESRKYCSKHKPYTSNHLHGTTPATTYIGISLQTWQSFCSLRQRSHEMKSQWSNNGVLEASKSWTDSY